MYHGTKTKPTTTQKRQEICVLFWYERWLTNKKQCLAHGENCPTLKGEQVNE